MSLTSGILLPISAVAVFVGVAAAQDAPKLQLTARQLYYFASDKQGDAQRSSTPKPAAKAPVRKPAAKPVTEARKSSEPVASPPAAPSAPAPPASNVENAPVTHNAISTAPMPASGQPLGLRYTLLKLSGGNMVEVPTDTTFHAGDRIQFNVQGNTPGYLYIVSQGSSGTWKPMFPSPESAQGSNRIEPYHSYTMPPNTRFVFDEQSGAEKIFIVLSREPETDLEKLIYSLQGKSQPAGSIQNPKEPALVIASARIENSMVGRLRDAYSRDLIVEKVTADTPGDRRENAVYVVNPTGSADSRVVADLSLVHR